MPQLLDEKLLPFAKAIRLLPGRPHISTGYRFISKGCRGVILETVLVGGRRFCSREALRRFVTAVTAAASTARPNSIETESIPHQESGVERDLDDAGII
jgi:Protein of unknown function (DUF1580)